MFDWDIKIVDRKLEYTWGKVLRDTALGTAAVYLMAKPLSLQLNNIDYTEDNQKNNQIKILNYATSSYLPVTISSLIILIGMSRVDKDCQSINSSNQVVNNC